MAKGIYWMEKGKKEVNRDLLSDYNTDNFTEEELADLCNDMRDEDYAECGIETEYFVSEC